LIGQTFSQILGWNDMLLRSQTGHLSLDTTFTTLRSLGEVVANIPNGGPLATPGDPGYVSLNSLRLPYTPGDQVGPDTAFFTAALATRGLGEGAGAEGEAEAQTTTQGAPGAPNNGSLSGTPTQIPPLSDAVTTRSLTLENQSATVLADSGYDVVQNPDVSGPKNPDYLIDGEIFDNYAPSTGNVRNIASTISDKVSSGQASNIVVNLTDSSTTTAALEAQLTNYPVPGLKQVIVIDQSGAVIKLNIKGN